MWWTCAACGKRWERIPLTEFEPSMSNPLDDNDILTFGKHLGYTYLQVWKQDPNYCQWVLETAEMGDASPQLKRFAHYVAQKERQEGFPEIPAGRFDEEL